MIGVIYKITNLKDGKVYIGQTTKPDPIIRIRSHFNMKRGTRGYTYLHRAMDKHGRENFSFEFLLCSKDRDALNFLEMELIVSYNCLVPNGYNIRPGGGNSELAEETKRKISAANTNRFPKGEHPLCGRKFTKDHCENLSKVRKGFTSPAREAAQKISATKLYKAVLATNLSTGESKRFESYKSAQEFTGVHHTNISRVCSGKRKQDSGWTFRRLNKY